MTSHKHAPPVRAALMARLLGGASLAVLISYSPALAQDLNITIDSGQTSAFTGASVTGFETVANNTQDSRAAVTATIAGGALDSNIAGSGSSAVGIEDNALTATASGNVFTLDADQLGSSGNGSAGTLATLSGQFVDATVSTSITGSSLTIDGTGEAASTSLAASDNTISATTTVNNATSVFSDDISADLAGDLAQAVADFDTSPITLTGGVLTAQQVLSVEGGGSVVASTQAVEGLGLVSTATITGSGISVSLENSDATGSALAVDGNDIRASLTGNRASTGTDLTVDTAFDNSAAVLSQQQLGDGTTNVGLVSTADTSTLSVALDNSTDSNLTVSSNTIGAQANGNVATLDGSGAGATIADGTFLRVDANTITSNDAGGEINNDLNSVVTFDDGSTGNPGFGFVAGSQQAVESTAAGMIEASSDGNSLSVTAADSTVLGGALSGSNLSVTDNTAFALASANTGGTAIDLSATSITATAGLASDQTLGGTDVNALLGDTGAFALSVTAEGDVTSSSILVDDNLSVAEASGNTGQTLLKAVADTALLSNNTMDRGTGTINLAAPSTVVAADFGVSANQRITGSDLTSTAVSALGVTVGETGTPGDAGAIDASTISLSSNVQQATTSGNTSTNRIDLDANVIGALDTVGPTFADNTSAVSSLASVQNIDSATSAASTTTLSLTQADFAGTTSVDASSLAIDANENRATTTANSADSTLAVTADTAIIGADAANANAINNTTSSDITAAGTSGLANVQSSTGTAIGATTEATADITAGGAGATTASLSGSSASISDNITTASGAANIGTSAITLAAGTEITSSAALTNQQTNSAGVTGSATFDAAGTDGVLLTGIVTGSTLGIDDNVSVGSAMGNQTANALSVTATTIDRTANAATGVLDQRSTNDTIDNVGADFASLNTQVQTGNISSAASSLGTLSVAETNTGVSFDADLTNSSATLNGNSLQSDAMSNLATNSVSLDGSAGVSATTTGLASIQQTGVLDVGTPSNDILVDIGSVTTGTFNVVTENGDITNSTVAIDGNQAFDSATSNRATNTLSVLGNSISGTSADLTTVGVTLEPTVGAKVDGDNSLSSVQVSILGAGSLGLTSASTIDGTIALGGASGGAGVSGSSVSISDNFARSFGMGNDASNAISLAADTSFSGTAALTGTQVLSGDVTSAATVNADLDARVVPDTDAVASSSLATDGNIAFSRAMGNNQANTLGVSGTSITGVSNAAADQEASVAELGAANNVNRTLEGDNIITAFQGLQGAVSGTATVDSNISATDDIDASSVSASENIAQSNVIGNAGNNLLNLAADTGVTGVSVLASEQNGRTSANISSVADLDFVIDQDASAATDDFTSSTLNVDNNLGFSTAFGNDVTNRLNVSGTSVSGNDDALSVAGISAGIVSGTSDNLIGNVQFRDASPVSSIATLNATLFDTADLGGGNQLDGSSVSLSGNTLDSTATSNRANNALVLNAATGLTSGGAIANQQNSASNVTSDVGLVGSVGSGAFDDVNASSIALRDNTGIARAAGNDATNVLNASAGTAITGIVGTGSATALSGALNATGTFASASNQVNSGAVLARASFDDATMNESDLSVQTAALNSASVDLSGNRLVADAVSNRVVNSMTVSGRSPSTLVSTALTTRQVATGAVTSEVDSFRLASTNAGLTSSSVGLSGNTFSASAGGNIATSRLVRD